MSVAGSNPVWAFPLRLVERICLNDTCQRRSECGNEKRGEYAGAYTGFSGIAAPWLDSNEQSPEATATTTAHSVV